MEIEDLLAKANDGIHVGRVYGTPIERDGALVIPAAVVRGGGGLGRGTGSGPEGEGEGEGTGGGFGLNARPAGVFVIRDGVAKWQPAVDPNRIVAAIATVTVVALLVHGSVRRTRARHSG